MFVNGRMSSIICELEVNVMNPKVFIRAAILAVLVALATTQECSYDDREGYIIDIHNSEKNGAIFMSDMISLTRESCQSACCNFEEEVLDDGTTASCNLALFHKNRKKNTKNCFLVFCPRENACRLNKVKGFTSSYVTQILVPEPTEPEGFPVTNQSHKLADVSLSTGQSSESTESSTLLMEEETTSSPSTSKETLSPMSTSPLQSTPSNPTSKSASSHAPSSTLDPLRRNLQVNQTNIANDTAASVDVSDDDQEPSEHSVNASNGALIAAVCFGIIFLLSVLVVLSKRWYEGYQRRHYSKVDYLINGMYN